MKRYYSFKTAITLFSQAAFFALVFLLAIVGAYIKNNTIPWTFWLIPFFNPLVIGYIVGALFCLRKVTISDNYIEISFFKWFFVKRFSLDSVVDIKAVYVQGSAKQPNPPVMVFFSKKPIPDCLPPRDERIDYADRGKNRKNLTMKFPFAEKDIVYLKGLFLIPIRELRLYERSITVAPQRTISQNPMKKITIHREKRFWGCGVPVYFCMDGEIIASAKNGQIVSFYVDLDKHSLYALAHLPQHSARSNIINIEGDNPIALNLKIKPAWWTGDSEYILTQIENQNQERI